jgi:hypothetical protein
MNGRLLGFISSARTAGVGDGWERSGSVAVGVAVTVALIWSPLVGWEDWGRNETRCDATGVRNGGDWLP